MHNLRLELNQALMRVPPQEKDHFRIEFIDDCVASRTLFRQRQFLDPGGRDDIHVHQDAVASIIYEIEDGRAEIEFQLSWTTGETLDGENTREDETGNA